MNNIHYARQSEVFDMIINQGVPYVRVKKPRYDLIYGRCSDGVGVTVVRCVPTGGNLLYEVGGTLSKTKPLTYNRFLAKSEREAKERYRNLYGWDAAECRFIAPGQEAEGILTNPLRTPL